MPGVSAGSLGLAAGELSGPGRPAISPPRVTESALSLLIVTVTGLTESLKITTVSGAVPPAG